MADKKPTKYPGVLACESSERRFRGKADISYMIEWRDASGKRHRKVVGWASQGITAALASQKRAEIIAAIKNGEVHILDPKKVITFGEAWERYKADWLIANGKDTVASQALVNQHFQKLMQLPLDQITPLLLDKLMVEIAGKGRTPQTVRHAVGLIRRIMRRMAMWRLYSGSMPFDAITLPKLNNARERFLTPEEAHALLAKLKERSQQMWLMALVSLHCGLRFGEIAAMQWVHIDFANGSIYIPESKSGKARHAVMTAEVVSELKAWQSVSTDVLVFPARGGGVMAAASDSFKRAVDAVGLNKGITDRRQKVVFHTLRHTYASWLAKSGQGQFAIADRLGHHSLEMTKRYTHLMDETRRQSADAISAMFTRGQNQES